MFPINEQKIARLRSLPRGKAANEIMAQLLSSRFLGYWTFAEPTEKGIELADALVVWGDTAILFEIKTRDSASGRDSRWVKKRLSEAITQINARAAMLRQGQVKAIRNKWRGVLPWTPETITTYLGVVVLHHNSDPYDPAEVAGDRLSRSTLPIHVLSLWDVAELLRFVNTVTDLIVYLELRDVLRSRRASPLRVHQEEEVYREMVERWVELANPGTPPTTAKAMQDFRVSTFNATVRSEAATEQGYAGVAQSFLVDLALGSLARRADPDDSGTRVGGPNHDLLIEAMGSLAELSRERRAFYGNLWLHAANEAIKSGEMGHESASSRRRRRSYIIAAAPGLPPDPAILAALAAHAMEVHQTTTAIALGASAERVLAAYQLFLSWSQGHDATIAEDDSQVLDTQCAYLADTKARWMPRNPD
jgi:hypothetical protein